jgi:oligopeptide/dipeptide ABC transporter ATP-binding protein
MPCGIFSIRGSVKKGEKHMENDILLQVTDLHTHFFTDDGVVKAVDGVNFFVRKGRTLGIVGESGCGKSITALSILRLLDHPGRVVAGEIRFKGKELLSLTEKEMRAIRGCTISIIFQDPMTALNPVLTIGDQLSEVLLVHQGMSPHKARVDVIDMLSRVGVTEPEKRFDQYVHVLSGGIQQRAMIAMALLCKPDLLLADEPTTALDVTIQAQILELMRDIQNDLETSIVFITHDLGVIAELAHDIVVMYAGKIVESAPVRELFNDPRHPYTQGLLKCLPRLDAEETELFTIRGIVPGPFDAVSGCPYHTRCRYAKSICRERIPMLEEVAPGHQAACWIGGDEYGTAGPILSTPSTRES